MEKSSANTESQQQMSDVAMAQSYVRDIGGKGSAKSILNKAFARLSEMFPHRHEPEKQWTVRRVRGFLGGDAATVQFYEMVELHRAAEEAKAERELLAKARKEHADFIQKTASLRALLERQDEDFHSAELERLRGLSGGSDSPRIEG
jgi:hypothetical protein